jgi:preprotein translocase subunit SecA
LQAFYGLSIVPIPTNKPNIRKSWPLRSFNDSEKRNQAIVADAARLHRLGRPILIGTRTIRHSVRLSELLRESGVPHTVLNGVQDEDEAKIVGRAGVAGTVTVATNMAGRGTDIRLDAISLQSGGLHVIAAEHNLSPRVDRQLSGRAARQGNPGSSQFFISLEDELVQSEEELVAWIKKTADKNGECQGDACKAVRRIQLQMEAKAYEQRQRMVARDAWMDGVLKTLASS